MQLSNHGQHKDKLLAATLLALILGSYVHNHAAASDMRDISRINSGISVEAAERVGDVSTVNGGIHLHRGVQAARVDTVNGGIELADEVTLERAETVNGGIRTGKNVRVSGYLETVNGSIQTRAGTEILGQVRTVNGKIVLQGTRVEKNIETSNGDIDLRNGTVVAGDIVVRAKRSWLSRLFSFNRRPSALTIDGDSAVLGDIHLYREVRLRIDDAAEVGAIIEHF
jgi:DUF4097 and DUF4098 domain-containing protein YvlB